MSMCDCRQRGELATCPREAAARGSGLMEAKISDVGLPRDAAIVFRACNDFNHERPDYMS